MKKSEWCPGWGKTEPLCIAGRNAAVGKQDGSSSKKLIELPNDPVTPLLGVYPKEFHTEAQTDIYLYTHAHSSISHNSQKAETTHVSMDRQRSEQNVVSKTNKQNVTKEYYSACKRKKL